MSVSGPTPRQIDRLIQVLARNATVVLPGPKIAEEIGVSRSTVFDWIEKLRALGVEIKGLPATGYQLARLPDLLVPSLLRREVGDGEFGAKIVHYFRIDSTNTVALRLATEGAAHGTVVLAEEQTAGRGRFGRAWYSERGSGIYLSLVLKPQLSPTAAPMLTLLAGLAVQTALERTTGLRADIRWPNDLLVGGKKLCGILTEMSAEVDRLHAVVIGIGINVNHAEVPEELAAIATSLRIETGRVQSRAQIVAAVLRELERLYLLFLKDGGSAIAERWMAASSYASGKRIRVHTAGGDFEATTTGLDPSGALRVRRDDGREHPLVAGEIVEVR